MAGLVCVEDTPEEGDLVVAIDFGTSRTAVAYTIVVEGDNEVVNVLTISGAGGFVRNDYKTPTSVLIQNGEVLSFGYSAQELFVEEEREPSPDWLLFKCFKMTLHKPFQDDPCVECFGGGHKKRLSFVLQKCLEYIKRDVMSQLELMGLLQDPDPTKLFWILTIPAIWSDHAKFVMRTAAFKAGIIGAVESSHLHLALEPECAAIATQADQTQQSLWSVGTKFLVADCGGGTLDITTHEIVRKSPLRLKELLLPAGGPMGATLIDKNFLDFFATLVGKERFKRFEHDDPAGYESLLKQWEEKKVMFQFKESQTGWTKLRVVDVVHKMGITGEFASLIDAWNAANPRTPVEALKDRKVKLALSYNLMKSFYEHPVASVVEKVGATAAACEGLNDVILAGGFSRCGLLQQEMKKRFEATSVRVVVANDPDLTIVKGAALFGAGPVDPIIIRKSKYTFGIGASRVYNPDDAEHQRNRGAVFVGIDGKERLDVFSVHGRVGDDLDVAKPKRRCYTPVNDDQKSCRIAILVTKRYHVLLEKEEGVQELAVTSVPFDMKQPFRDRQVFVEFSFGGPEVRCLFYGSTGEEQVGTPLPIKFNFFQS
ncbi:hypothetical protein BSKO_01785 [Bryopsis sp. KO-2023]|nr:hypothetical protein BSKO_01785 [Bryopsis sp. KO-2023]